MCPLSLAFLLRVFVRRRGECWRVSILVGLKEMTLLSGSDQCRLCVYVASENGKQLGRDRAQ